jgi:hypothetical protein
MRNLTIRKNKEYKYENIEGLKGFKKLIINNFFEINL